MVLPFINDDHGYQTWCNEHQSGYVATIREFELQARNNVIHRVRCPQLRNQGALRRWTVGSTIVCSTQLDELKKYLEKTCGESWSYCNSCF
ncbi:hypothetical protein [Hazenella coriacea]|uniref:Uncharacterized protein n=1 Tax=Hazenella coriacea TaxID=1179467 RepID=A0A4V2UVP5_9BACL|nr:hypothetical protein [Hazenella coriacea]TCS96597.1 hypothetical protein EDD58_101233 [Hazenella coriacea]